MNISYSNSILHSFFGSAGTHIVINDRIEINKTVPVVQSLNNTSGNVTSNMTSSIMNVQALCGFPAFCKYNATETCSNMSLSYCDDCSTSLAYVMFIAVLLMSLVILLTNAIVMTTVAKQNHQVTNVDLQRFSLGLADMLTGKIEYFVYLLKVF